MENTTWQSESVHALFALPFFDLITRARAVHQVHFPIQDMELCTLSSIKTGACPEDCAYCPQSGHYNTGLKKERLIDIDSVIEQAKIAKANGAVRFCMGAAWRCPPVGEFPKVLKMVKAVKELGLEACMTLGMLNEEQAQQLKAAGLDFYNHNLDTSPEFYGEIITTRTYEDRLQTLAHVANAGMNTCCGGILGMGETREDRVQFLLALARLDTAPRSIPINKLIQIPGTPLADVTPIDSFEFVRTIAVARIMFPASRVRLSAGREDMSDEMQAWCFMAGANSIFIGDKLLTAGNPSYERDKRLLTTLGFTMPVPSACEEVC